MIRRLTIALAICTLALGVPAGRQGTKAVMAASPRVPLAFAVPSTQPWSDTGLVVVPGMVVTIAATGTILINLNGVPQTPNGQGGTPGCIGDASYIAPGLPCWSLIGRIGNGAPFEVGSQHVLVVPAVGHLFLGVNDQVGQFGDNSGAWTAYVKTIPILTYSVPSTQPWTDTGLVVSAGVTVTVAATGTILVNLNGVPQPPSGQGGTPGCIGDTSYTAPGLPCWSLIGLVGNGTPFEIGNRHTFVAPASGHLLLGVNDQIGQFGDNSGAWTAYVIQW